MTLDEQFLQHLGGVRTNSLRELLQATNVDEENMHSLIPRLEKLRGQTQGQQT